MSTDTNEVAAAITDAKEDLDRALAALSAVPAFDPHALAFSAHALSNYLSVAQGSVDLVQDRLGPDADPTVLRLLGALKEATDRMAQVVRQLGQRASVGASRFILSRVDLPRLVRFACDYYRRVAEPKRIAITYRAAAPSRFVRTDRVAVAAVFDNLISNAIKYSPPGSTVTVTVVEEGDELVVDVADQGPGIAPEDQPKLFQRGVRLGAEPTGGEPSHGFGLAVAKELVDKIGGRIGCHSQPGRGAEFWFALPREKAPGGPDEGE